MPALRFLNSKNTNEGRVAQAQCSRFPRAMATCLQGMKKLTKAAKSKTAAKASLYMYSRDLKSTESSQQGKLEDELHVSRHAGISEAAPKLPEVIELDGLAESGAIQQVIDSADGGTIVGIVEVIKEVNAVVETVESAYDFIWLSDSLSFLFNEPNEECVNHRNWNIKTQKHKEAELSQYCWVTYHKLNASYSWFRFLDSQLTVAKSIAEHRLRVIEHGNHVFKQVQSIVDEQKARLVQQAEDLANKSAQIELLEAEVALYESEEKAAAKQLAEQAAQIAELVDEVHEAREAREVLQAIVTRQQVTINELSRVERAFNDPSFSNVDTELKMKLSHGAQGDVEVRVRMDGIEYVRKRQLLDKMNAHPSSCVMSNEIVSLQWLPFSPYFVKVLDYQISKPDQGSQYFSADIAYEYCKGGDLSDWLLNLAKINVEEQVPELTMWHVLRDCGRALLTVHGWDKEWNGWENNRVAMLHGDIKPDNIFLRQSVDERKIPEFVLGDFGLASPEVDNLGCLGTPMYMAPEVYNVFSLIETDAEAYKNRGQCVSTLSDIYSLGVVLQHCMIGAYRYDDEVWPLDLPEIKAEGTCTRSDGRDVQFSPKLWSFLLSMIEHDVALRMDDSGLMQAVDYAEAEIAKVAHQEFQDRVRALIHKGRTSLV